MYFIKQLLIHSVLLTSFWSLSACGAFAQTETSTDGVLFYLYPLTVEDAPDPETRFSDSVENADLSFSIWSDAPSMKVYPNANETKGLPVTAADFKKTWNYHNKRLSVAYVVGSLDLSPIDFDSWTFYRVSIAGSVNISRCSFSKALFYRCALGGTLDEKGNWIAQKAAPGCGITFEQFSQTLNYQNADCEVFGGTAKFSFCRLIGLDLSDWDFSNRSLVQLELEDCQCVSSNKRTNFEGSQWALKNWDFKELLGNGENLRKTGSGLRGPHYVAPESKKAVFPKEAVAEQLYQTWNYKENNDLRFMQIDLRDVNLSGTTLEFGYVAVYPETVLEGAVIRNATFKASGDATSDAGITNAILYTTKSYRDHNLSGVTFECNLTGCDLSTQNLSAARFQTSDVSGADFTDAVVTRCDFSGAKGLTREQIESTWNYKMGNMAGIKLPKELEELAAANTTESAR